MAPRFALLLCMPIAGLACGAPDAPSVISSAPIPESTVMAAGSNPEDLFEGAFPPAWKVGDRWRVIMTVPSLVELRTSPGKTIWEDTEYRFEVESVPAGDDGVYRVAVDNDARDAHFVATYLRQPFSFVRLDDRSGANIEKVTKGTLFGGTPPSPYVGGVRRGFITDFPAHPGASRAGVYPVTLELAACQVRISPTRDGVQWTYSHPFWTETVTWARGAPWWSKLEKRVPPDWESSATEPLAFSGRLVRP